MGRAPVAELRLIEGVHYRRDAWTEGFRSLGYDISYHGRHVPREDDVLLLWNRYARDEMRAREYEASGATVLITENAWLGPEAKEDHWFALCVGHHNGPGAWRVGSAERWANMGISLKPWRSHGHHILVLPQRGMGEEGVKQPVGWLERTIRALEAKLTIEQHHTLRRPIVVRRHPGPRGDEGHKPIEEFTDAWACVTWASGAAIKALVEGVPVFYGLRHWIAGPAARLGFDDLEMPFVGDRLSMFQHMAWAMWRAEEIATGGPLAWLLCKSPFTSTESSAHGSTSAPIWRRASSESATSLA